MRAQHFGAALLLSLVAAAPAAADTRDVFHFADPFDGSADCGTFVDNWECHDRGTVTDFFRDGVPYREIGKIHSIETDMNSVTGKSVVVRPNVTVNGDLSPEGELLRGRSPASSSSATLRARASSSTTRATSASRTGSRRACTASMTRSGTRTRTAGRCPRTR